ncbi:MAG: hypothetical protein BM564_07460 [Bacteroidetes bacterium MedPE-SWsnd-G2]|nr:MAG: hypothetical protein BM564_07460 [Bacteroidetes bacterium MedPE-SWsnd-G2]
MKLYTIPLLMLLSMFGCKHVTTSTSDHIFIGGEIINPKNDYVLLYLSESNVDTLYMNEHNRFSKRIEQVPAGLYTFTHGGEYQTILLEPNDSILFRLNTADFDESLVFTGKGAKKNNYLIKRFLENEIDNKKFIDYCKLAPEEFEVFLNKKRREKLDNLDKFIKKKEPSELFKSIAELSINYNYYANKEIYPFGYYGNNKLIHFKDLPEGFYDFRKDINYNFEALQELFVYNRFLYSHFNNLALEHYYKDKDHHDVFNRNALGYNVAKLEIMDSLITSEVIKNNLLKTTTKDFLFNSESRYESDKMLAAYSEITTNQADKMYMANLVTSLEKLKPGKDFPNITLVNFHDQEIKINTLIKKPTVIFFWSSNFKMHYRNTHYKITNLKEQYPDMEFIAININNDNKMHWKNTLSQSNYPTTNEYRFKFPAKAIQMLGINSVNKVIVVNKEGVIKNSNANMFDDTFDDYLEL